MTASWLLDLDGVLWRGGDPIEGAAAAVARLRDAGVGVAFFTNNSLPTIAGHLAKLAAMGVEAHPEELLTSAQAAVALLEPGERALAVGGAGILEALHEAGVEGLTVAAALDSQPSADGAGTGRHLEALDALRPPRVDAVLVGIDLDFDVGRLTLAMRTVRAGARLIATNDDATYPTPGGLVPGAGSMVAAIARASGVEAVVAGKPHQPAAELARARLGEIGTVVGDRPETDGLLARRLGARFALVTSGVTPAGHGPLDPEPDVEAPSLSHLVDQELAR